MNEDSKDLIREISEILERSRSERGFQGFGHSVASALLYGAYLAPEKLSEHHRRLVANKAPFEAAKNGKISVDTLVGAIANVKAELAKLPKSRFRFQSGLLISGQFKIKQKSIQGIRISQGGSWHPLTVGDDNFKWLIESHLDHDLPSFVTPMLMDVEASDVNTAAELAFKALDVRRGIWNLRLNRIPIMRSGRNEPHSFVLRAPITTAEASDGTTVLDQFWYEDYARPPRVTRVSHTDWEAVARFEEQVHRKIAASDLRSDIESALSRYAYAMDSHDPHVCFMRLWGLLEFLTSSSTDNGKTTARRASFIFKNARSVNVSLLAMRVYRNRYVHGAYEGLEITALLQQLDEVVGRLLKWQIATAKVFSSLQECAEFLDLPQDIKRLKRSARLSKLAQTFIGQGSLDAVRSRQRPRQSTGSPAPRT